ncbi:MAG TPA: GntR family transcriptional regulator [Myxococcota bacterium]|nr:GntR family transcriptional regulator [Myxococcota bacterium]
MTRTEQAAEALTRRVIAGEWTVGSVLPAERRLAESMGVSRPTLRAALAQLCAAGLLSARQGSGYRVRSWRETGGFDLLPHLLAQPDRALAAGFLELRRCVAAEAVARACERASDGDIEDLEVMARAQQAEVGAAELDAEAFAARDIAFSQRVVRAAGNPALVLLFNTVMRTYAVHPELAAAMHTDRAAVAASYPAVVALLRAGDPEQARGVVSTTLEALDALTLARLA